MRRRVISLLVTALPLSAFALGTSMAVAPAGAAARLAHWGGVAGREPTYVGSRDGCRKCHLREYRSWERTPHASAIEVLSDAERTDPACIGCHATGVGQPGGFVSLEATPQLAGIGCEACHGPGSDYLDREVMKSREASVAAGMLVPDERTCRACHNERSPTFPGSFDYEAMRADGVHEIRRAP